MSANWHEFVARMAELDRRAAERERQKVEPVLAEKREATRLTDAYLQTHREQTNAVFGVHEPRQKV